MNLLQLFRLTACALILGAAPATAQPTNRMTILYDAFGKSNKLTKDWGFAALVEYGGKRILFDTGNNADIFARNVMALGVDLKKLDFVVISHRHADHTSGLSFLLSVNPNVTIYTPDEPFGAFGKGVPNSFYRKDESLTEEMRYFDGKPPETLAAGTPWPKAHFVPVSATTEVSPGIFLVPTTSQVPGTLELRELSLAIKTANGVILVDGCSHAGVEKILEAVRVVDPHVRVLFGGLHLVKAPDPEVERIALALRDQWKLDSIAPGHCTGEPEFAALKKTFADRYIYAGVGTVVSLPLRAVDSLGRRRTRSPIRAFSRAGPRRKTPSPRPPLSRSAPFAALTIASTARVARLEPRGEDLGPPAHQRPAQRADFGHRRERHPVGHPGQGSGALPSSGRTRGAPDAARASGWRSSSRRLLEGN